MNIIIAFKMNCSAFPHFYSVGEFVQNWHLEIHLGRINKNNLFGEFFLRTVFNCDLIKLHFIVIRTLTWDYPLNKNLSV